jgi:hypothetical protein
MSFKMSLLQTCMWNLCKQTKYLSSLIKTVIIIIVILYFPHNVTLEKYEQLH